MDNQAPQAPQAQPQAAQPQAASPQPNQAHQPRQEPQGQQPQGDTKKPHERKDEKTGRFGQAALEAKRQAAIAALREERGVAAPTATQAVVPETLTTQAQMAAVHAIPKEPEYGIQGMTPAQIDGLLAKYDQKIQETQRLAAQVAAKEAEAAAKLAKIEMAKGDPLQFLAEAGITDQEWQSMLGNGGSLTPEQQEIKALKQQMADFMNQNKEKEAMASREARRSHAATALTANPLAKMMANPDGVLQHQELMSKRTGREVAIPEVIADLTNTYKQGVLNLLNNPEIAAMLNLSVPKPQSDLAVSNSPTTLGSKLASSTTPSSGRPAPNDWAAKKALVLQQLAALKRNQ